MVALSLLAAVAAPAHGSHRWSDWASKDDDALTASFVPWAETRQRDFSRSPFGYASIFWPFSPFVGELVLLPGQKADGDDATALAEPVTLVVEMAIVHPDRAAAPSVADDAHYALNPFLPFGVPPGVADKATFAYSVLFPAGTRFPLRAPVLAASAPRFVYNWPVRVRWKALDKGGATVASGILSDAFAPRNSYSSSKEIELFSWKGDEGSSSCGSYTALATDASFRGWPMLARQVKSFNLNAATIDRVFGDDPEAFAAFLRRARLVGVGVVFDGTATESPVFKSVADKVSTDPPIVGYDANSRYKWSYALDGEAPCNKQGHHSEEEAKAFELHHTIDEALIEPARIPGDALGRDTSAYVVATAIFMLLFTAGTAALLIRFFAKRRGEARLAVWTALPLWCVAASAAAFIFVLPLLDRAPRADITEWRYAIAGEPEELRIESGRAHSFSRSPTSWTMAQDGWFSEEEMQEGASLAIGDPSGRMTLFAKPRIRGEREEVVAMRLAPHDGQPLSVSVDTKARPATADEFAALLKGWLRADVVKAETPEREVTANADYAGVWVFTRGFWYGLGPMKKGEARKLDGEVRLWQGPELYKKPYTTLFRKAPFAVRRAAVSKEAEKWLAAFGEGKEPPPIDDKLTAAICSATVFALREGEAAETDLSPVFTGRKRPLVKSRIVQVEVFQ